MSNPIETMLVHIDGSEESVTAAQYGIALSKWTGAKLIVCYVVNTRALDDLVKTRIFLETEQEEYRSDLESDAQRYLSHVVKMAEEKGVTIETVKASGSVYSEIKRLVKERDIDLLIVKEISHVRSRRDEFYNETERAMRSVNCSVLVVKDSDRVWELFDNLL